METNLKQIISLDSRFGDVEKQIENISAISRTK